MIYLYIKTHLNTGLKYFGKTHKNPETYMGSGKYWKRHLKVHGNNVKTEIFGIFEDETECKIAALKFSIDNNIVESDEWANLILENGLDGMPHGNVVPEETKQKISNSLIGKPSKKSKYVLKESRKVRSERSRNIAFGTVWANNGVECKRLKMPLPEGWLPGRLGDIGDKNLGNKNKFGFNTKGKKIYNNGTKHAYFLPDNVPDGWTTGKMPGYQGGTGAMKRKEKNGKQKIQRTKIN